MVLRMHFSGFLAWHKLLSLFVVASQIKFTAEIAIQRFSCLLNKPRGFRNLSGFRKLFDVIQQQ